MVLLRVRGPRRLHHFDRYPVGASAACTGSAQIDNDIVATPVLGRLSAAVPQINILNEVAVPAAPVTLDRPAPT